jgi:hypothetical protein
VGLADILEALYRRALRLTRPLVARWADREPPRLDVVALQDDLRLMKETLAVARGGVFVQTIGLELFDAWGDSERSSEAWGRDRALVLAVWRHFRDACGHARQIDDFLAALERRPGATGLARACRDEVTGLLVLADWCDENGLPASATEARYLFGLLREVLPERG